MSDSEEYETKFDIDALPEQSRGRIKKIIHEGKQITPFYDDDTLYKIYKKYYQSDRVFLNQLSIIAKRREEEKKQDQGGWIFVGNGINGSGVNKRNTSDRRENNRGNYSYLQDKKLVWRALNWEKKQAKNVPGLPQKIGEVEEQTKKATNSKNQTQKYKEKPNLDKKKSIEEQNPKKIQSQPKEVKYQEQVKPAVKPLVEIKPQQDVKVVPVEKEDKRIEEREIKNKPKKYQEKNPSEKTEEKINQSINNKKKSYKQKEPVNKTNERKRFVEKKSEPEISSKVPEKKIHDQTPKLAEQSKVQKQQDPKKNHQEQIMTKHEDPNANFEQMLKKYPKVLKFIRPGDKMQIITYNYMPNGSIDDVKVRVPLAEK